MIELEIQRQLEDPQLPDDARLRSWAEHVLAGCGAVMVHLRIVDLAEGWALNRQWRGKDAATNVLSFPADMPPINGARVLGDVVLCAPVIAREAAEQGKPLEAHWAHLVTHGLLHLLGHDHIKAEQAAVMEAREVELLNALGYSNPYDANNGI
ncbi:MAG: rRNA maturation RNase YbeY [Wenzhouxiangella sp.]